MLMRSISSGSARPTPNASATPSMSATSRSRCAAVSFFESSTPGRRAPGARITAAATTGPASGLIPASSTPAMRA
jgi:hypothetical protein